MVFRAWAHERCHKTRNGWYLGLVEPISSIVGFDSFNGGLFRAFTNFGAVLRVNNSLVRCVRPASSWPRDSLS